MELFFLHVFSPLTCEKPLLFYYNYRKIAKVFTDNVAINQTMAMRIRTIFGSENKRNNNKHTDKRVLFSSYHRRRIHYSAAFFTLQPKQIVSALPGGRPRLLRTVHRQGRNPHLPMPRPRHRPHRHVIRRRAQYSRGHRPPR